jgi:hypothetical protein
MSTSTIALDVMDWNASRRAELADVPPETTVGELVAEVREAMGLPRDTPYELIYQGEKLHRGATLGEVGLRNGEELTIAPEVSAGRVSIER